MNEMMITINKKGYVEPEDIRTYLALQTNGEPASMNENGDEQESLGIAFLKNLYGNDTIWKQTSTTNSFRKQYAGIGFFYDSFFFSVFFLKKLIL